MAYELLQCGKTQFAVDWSVVRRLIRSYYTAQYQRSYAREVTLSDSHWYNPMSWELPDVTNIEVDWQAVRQYADADTGEELRIMQQRAKTDAAAVASRLEWMIDSAALNKEAFLDWMGNVQTQNMVNINKAVDAYQSDVEIARFLRNSSADGLMVGASVMSGGAALTLMGAGSMLKGHAKFQDSGSIGAGIMEGVGTFAFAYVKLGKQFSFKQDMVLAIVQSTYKTGTELVSGVTLGKAALTGSLKLTGPAVDRLFRLGPAKTLFDKVAVPVVITYGDDNVASKLLGKFTATMLQKRGIEGSAKNALLSPGSSNTTSSTIDLPHQHASVISETTLTNKYLLYLSFVNMDKGIGRGW